MNSSCRFLTIDLPGGSAERGYTLIPKSQRTLFFYCRFLPPGLLVLYWFPLFYFILKLALIWHWSILAFFLFFKQRCQNKGMFRFIFKTPWLRLARDTSTSSTVDSSCFLHRCALCLSVGLEASVEDEKLRLKNHFFLFSDEAWNVFAFHALSCFSKEKSIILTLTYITQPYIQCKSLYLHW